MSENTTAPKYSVYIALAAAGLLAALAVVTQGSTESVNLIITELLAFAGIRQGIKSFLGK